MRIHSLLTIALVIGSGGQAVAASEDQGSAYVLPELVIDTGSPVQARFNDFDHARDEALQPKIGASSYGFDAKDIQALPGGTDTAFDKVLLQAPGVNFDSAVSFPTFHIRNEYSNSQYRINGIMLPEGVAALGSVLDTNFVGSINLLDGVLPAQYGLRTAGVIDVTTKTFAEPLGHVGISGGSHETVAPSFDYGGISGTTQYFATGRFTANNEGIERATPGDPIHDRSQQGKFFGYVSTLLGDSNRLTFMTGAAINQLQIPNVPGQVPLGDFGGLNVNSATLNERENDSFLYNIVALQTKGQNFDTQISLYSRYATSHFIPDVPGDLAFNDVASNVARESLLNGLQFDGSYKLNEIHTLRGGFGVSAEETQNTNQSTVLPLDANGNPLPQPVTITDYNSKLGWNIGGYVQDEWKLTDKLTLNTGLRFDQLYQFVSANQFSPRIALNYKVSDATNFHIGYARYFTPPSQSQASPANLALFANTTLQPMVQTEDPVRPERSHYFDAGVDHKLSPNLDIGADVYYKLATDLLDDGQFGQALVLTQFNAARAYSEGFELKAKYHNGGFKAYANFAASKTQSKDIDTNQYLIDDVAEAAYIAKYYHWTDDAQLFTASAGASYQWDKTLVSLDGIYGSGLRSGFANLAHEQPYATFNLGLSQAFDTGRPGKPLTARFNVVNLFDTVYVLRDGTGIGEFAPQYGPRRGFFLSLSQTL